MGLWDYAKTLGYTKTLMIDNIYFVFGYIYYSYTKFVYIKKSIKNYIGNNVNVKYECVGKNEYDNFVLYEYRFFKNDSEYKYNYLIRNDQNESGVFDDTLDDTYDNLEEKEKNNVLLHASFMLNSDTIICDITNCVINLRYYFDCSEKKKLIYWRDIYEIIKTDYTKGVSESVKNERLNILNNTNDIYLYLILNDESLTEKTLILSSVIDKIIYFDV